MQIFLKIPIVAIVLIVVNNVHAAYIGNKMHFFLLASLFLTNFFVFDETADNWTRNNKRKRTDESC